MRAFTCFQPPWYHLTILFATQMPVPFFLCCYQASAHFRYCRKTQLFSTCMAHHQACTEPARTNFCPIRTCTAIVYLKPSIRECTWRDLFDDDTLISKTIDLINLGLCIRPIEYISKFTACIHVQSLPMISSNFVKEFSSQPRWSVLNSSRSKSTLVGSLSDMNLKNQPQRALIGMSWIMNWVQISILGWGLIES